MAKPQKLIQLLMALVLMAGLLAPAAMQVAARPAQVQPALAEIAAAAPDELVRVIVQKAGGGDQAEALVKQLGGEVTKNFGFIHSFAAELPGKAVAKLGQSASVNWVALDAPMAPAGAPVDYVRDEFNTVSYNNNDGTDAWASAWIETYDNFSPSGGDITVEYDWCPESSSRCIEMDGRGMLNLSIEREVDLSGKAYAVLTFDYRLDNQAEYVVEVSSNGGSSWTTLQEFTVEEVGSASFDLSPYMSSTTRIRFRLTSIDIYAHLYIDNVEIYYNTPYTGTGNVWTVRDEFNTIDYGQNDGTLTWDSDWIESDDGSVVYGNTRVYDSSHCYDTNCIKLMVSGGVGDNLYRHVNLNGVSAATLTYYYDHALEDSDQVVAEVSTDGGATYTVLKIYNESVPEPATESIDLTPYLSADFRLRFRITNSDEGGSIWIDNVQIEAVSETETYLETLGVDSLHNTGLTGQGVTVAVVDSGIAPHPDFAGRLLTTPEYGSGDLYGHGTHVAGIIGGDGSASDGTFTGVAPGANLLSLGVTDEYGMSYESDVVAALQWIFENAAAYNIKVVNISLNSQVEDTYNNSAIDAAVEFLWFKGIVAVASAGNSGINNTYNNAKAAPANDPFIIVVGASDEYDTATRVDDLVADFTAYGISLDGHDRPDLIAPGYNLYAPLSPESTWDTAHPDRLAFGNQYIRLSGTSMAAPTVAGVVALLLEDEPTLNPNEIKYRLIRTNAIMTNDGSYKFAYLDAYTTIHGTRTAEANQGLVPHQILAKMALIAYWASQNGAEAIDWDSVNWDSVNWDSVNWDSVNWDSVNWDSVNWDSVNWDSVNWDSINWDSVNWDSVNWDSVNWDSVNWNSGGLNYLVGGDSSRQTGTGQISQSDGLFWGELQRDQAPTCNLQLTEKGTIPLTLCPVNPVFEK